MINEALTPADLATHLNEQIVIDLWSTMWLPPRIRTAWKRRFPELARLRETGKAA